MDLIVTNLEDIPDDLSPGRYCCRLESMTWQEMKVRFVPGSQHQPGDCLTRLTKAEDDDSGPLTDVPMVCTKCREPVLRASGGWYHVSLEGVRLCGQAGPVKAMVAAGNENVPGSTP